MEFSTTPGTIQHNIEIVKDCKWRLTHVRKYSASISGDSDQAHKERADCSKLISVFEADIRAYGGNPE